MKTQIQINPNIFKALFILFFLFANWQMLTPKALAPLAAINDKLNHILAFGGLFVFLHLGWFNKKALYYQLLFLFLWGISIEILQYFIPNRSFSIADIIADSFGLLLAFLGFIFYRKLIKKASY